MSVAWEEPAVGLCAAQVARFAALVPVLEDAQLRLRAPRVEDMAVYRACIDEDGGEALWLDFNQMVASWFLRGFGPWTIETPGGEALGILPLDHEYGDPEPEIGWFVLPEARRKGVATGATRLALAALPRLGFETIVSYIAPDNAASLAVAERLGGIRLPRDAHPAGGVVTHRYTLTGGVQ